MNQAKTEVNLEISTGFFRISTDNLVYNITVLGSPQPSSASPPVHATPAPPTQTALPLPSVAIAADKGAFAEDDFYKQISTDVFHDIGRLAKSLNSTIMDLPAEDRKMKRVDLNEAGVKIEDAKNQLRDIVSITEQATMEIMDHVEKVQNQTGEVRVLLTQLKEHRAFLRPESEAEGIVTEETEEGAGGQGDLMAKFNELEQKISDTVELLTKPVAVSPGDYGLVEKVEEDPELGDVQKEAQNEAREEAPLVAPKRFLFELDTVFQTIYELCTNETVKGHISSARKQAADFFDYNVFVDSISPQIAELELDDDNFYSVPLAVVLSSLAKSCSEKKICNLLTKMETNQDEIFLDSSLPLLAPPLEELQEKVVAAPAAPSVPPEPASSPEGEEKSEQARELMAEALLLLGVLRKEVHDGAALAFSSAGRYGMNREDQLDVFEKIKNVASAANNIYEDVTRITETLSFQDLSGQQILKIIKLLSDFQVQLLAIVVTFGSQLKSKERDTTITPQESKRLAQTEVDNYLKGMTVDQEQQGPLDQNTVNRMLEEFGF